MNELDVLVLAAPDDAALRVLDAPPPGVRLTVGWEPAELIPSASRAEILIACSAGRDRLKPVVDNAPRLRWIHSLSAGLDTLLYPELVASPVVLTNARGAYSRSLGEWVMAALLFFAKDLRRLVESQQRGSWDVFDPDWIQGKTLAIVGYGDIGRAAAEKARAFGMKVIGVRRRPAADAFCDEVVGQDALRAVLARADYVVVTLPLTTETRGLIGRDEIAVMPPHAVFVNIGRGPVVVESALVEALRARRIRGAALDVFDQEPLPAGHAFYTLSNVLLSPHTADRVPGWREDSMQLFLKNLELFRAGAPLRNVVDKKSGY